MNQCASIAAPKESKASNERFTHFVLGSYEERELMELVEPERSLLLCSLYSLWGRRRGTVGIRNDKAIKSKI